MMVRDMDASCLFDPGPGMSLWCMAEDNPAIGRVVSAAKRVVSILPLTMQTGKYGKSIRAGGRQDMKRALGEHTKSRYLLRIFAAKDARGGNIVRLGRGPMQSDKVCEAIRADVLYCLLGV